MNERMWDQLQCFMDESQSIPFTVFTAQADMVFNDMDTAEAVTCYGRKILTRMISTIEDNGGIVVETDTDCRSR